MEAGYNIGIAQVMESINKMLITYEKHDSKITIKEFREDLDKIFGTDNDSNKKRDTVSKYLDELKSSLNK